MPDAPGISSELLVGGNPFVLVFLPNTNELQRFVLAGAFAELGRAHQLHYVLPAADAQKMRDAAPLITSANSTTLDVPADRFKRWVQVFQAGCEHYAPLSPSFAIRANLAVDAGWRQRWEQPSDQRAVLDQTFDDTVRTMLDGLRPLPAMVELLDRFQPVYCIVPTSLLDLFCNEVVLACDVEGVACVLLQSGWDNLSSKGLLYSRAPFLGCWGPQSHLHAQIVQRMPPRKLGLLGAPHYEFLQPAPDDEVRRLRAELGVAADERMILFGGSFRQFDETSTLRLLDRAAARGRFGPVKIVYRPHPWRAARQHEDNFFTSRWKHVVFDPDMRERYLREGEEAGYIKRNVPMFDMQYLSKLISASDLVISPMSTLLVEALVLNKPTLAIAYGDGKHRHDPAVTSQMTHFAELRSSAAITWCDAPERLLKDMARLLRSGGAKAMAVRDQLLPQIVTRGPATYALRLEEFCRTTVEPLARKLRGRRTGVKRDTISHAYGAHLIAREYCGTDEDMRVPGYWMHGWIPSYHNIDPAFIALHKKEGQHEGYDFEAQIREERDQTIQWVSRVDQADFLRAHGYRHVKAIGLPIAYLPPLDLPRVPGSLLVMPPHSHRVHGPGDPLAEAYADAIAALKPRFEQIWVGVNEDDMAKRQWVESFRRRDIGVFTTTDQADPRTLVRLRRLLSTFEYVTTNGYGSHIALAAYCGAKVSVFGPYAEFPRERMKATHAVRMFPRLLDEAYYLCTDDALRTHYPFLFVEPHRAVDQRAWGAREVGESCRVTPAQLRRLFAWAPASRAGGGRRTSVAIGGAQPGLEARPPSPGIRSLVLFGMAHAGFFRNFEGVIARLLESGVDVHVHYSKAHSTISPDDYQSSLPASAGRFSNSVGEAGAGDAPRPAERVRIVRDILFYSRPHYAAATDLRARFGSLQKSAPFPAFVQRLMALICRVLPETRKDAIDAELDRREQRIPPHPRAVDLIEALRPDCVIVTPLVNFASREVELVKAAKQRGIPTLLAVASWDNLTNKGRIKIQPEWLAVWNGAMAREATELHGVPPDRIWITGAPVFDPWFMRAPTRSRTAFLRQHGLDEQRPLIVYLCSSRSIAGPHERMLVKEWLGAIETSEHPLVRKANVLIRPHPMAPDWAKMNLASAGQADTGEWRNAVIWPLEPTHPTTAVSRAEFFDTLYHADAVVGLNTSAMIEAAIVSKPILTFLGHDRVVSQTANLHFQHLTNGGAVRVAADLDEHTRQLAAVLDDGQGAVEACARFVESFVRPYGREIGASATLADMILLEMGLTATAPSAEETVPVPEGRSA